MSSPTEKPKPYTLARTAGGSFPELGNLFTATIGDFTDHLADYVMLGLGLFLIQIPAVFGLIFVLYFGMAVVITVGALGSGVLGAIAAEMAGDEAGALVGLGGTALTVVATIVGMFLLILVVAAVLAPITASVTRAVARHQRGEGKMTLQDAFSTAAQDLPGVMGITAIMVTGVIVGLCFCYFPGIAFGMVLSMAGPLVYLHQRPAVAAFREALADVMGNTSWYLLFSVVYFVLAMVASNVPILGQMFLIALHVRAFRERFGDEPALVASE